RLLGRRKRLGWRRLRRRRRLFRRRRFIRWRRGWGELVTVRLSDEDREKVSKAIAPAEANSNGEIVAVATPISDPYHDVALHWAVAAMILVLAWAAWRPDWLQGWYATLTPSWHAA